MPIAATALLIAHAVFASRPRTPLNGFGRHQGGNEEGEEGGQRYWGRDWSSRVPRAKRAVTPKMARTLETHRRGRRHPPPHKRLRELPVGQTGWPLSGPAAPTTVESVSDGDRHSQSQQ
jgi:hypothetical protein